jgi:hypothetical protein
VTLIVLDARPGTSALDNGALLSAPAAPTPISLMRAGVLVGGGDEQLALCIRGRGDWTQSAAFHRECAAAASSEVQKVRRRPRRMYPQARAQSPRSNRAGSTRIAYFSSPRVASDASRTTAATATA